MKHAALIAIVALVVARTAQAQTSSSFVETRFSGPSAIDAVCARLTRGRDQQMGDDAADVSGPEHEDTRGHARLESAPLRERANLRLALRVRERTELGRHAARDRRRLAAALEAGEVGAVAPGDRAA